MRCRVVTDQKRICLWPGCETPASCCCDVHWKLLPEDIRKDLTRCFDMFGVSRGHHNSIARAQAWIKSTFEAQPDRGHDPGTWERLKRWVRDRDERRRARAAAVTEPDMDPRAPAVPESKPLPRHLRIVTDDDA